MSIETAQKRTEGEGGGGGGGSKPSNISTFIINHYFHPSCSTRWATAHNCQSSPQNGPLPDASSMKRHRVPCYEFFYVTWRLTILLCCLGEQRCKLKLHRATVVRIGSHLEEIMSLQMASHRVISLACQPLHSRKGGSLVSL